MNLLKSKMTLYGDTQEDLANYLNMTRNTLASRLAGKTFFSQDEILKIKIRYDLTDEELILIFFTSKVTQNVR